jgi:hypothetical protein
MHIMRPTIGLLLLAGLLLVPMPGAAQVGFRTGRTSLGLGLSGDSETMNVAASFGYFVESHLELGVECRGSLSSVDPNLGLLAPFAEIYLLPNPPVAPFVRLSAGRLFIQDQRDGWMLHGGVGLAIFLGPNLVLSAELFRERYYLPPDPAEDLTSYRLGLGLMFG